MVLTELTGKVGQCPTWTYQTLSWCKRWSSTQIKTGLSYKFAASEDLEGQKNSAGCKYQRQQKGYRSLGYDRTSQSYLHVPWFQKNLVVWRKTGIRSLATLTFCNLCVCNMLAHVYEPALSAFPCEHDKRIHFSLFLQSIGIIVLLSPLLFFSRWLFSRVHVTQHNKKLFLF